MTTQSVKGTTIAIPNVDGGQFTAGAADTAIYVQTKFGTIDAFVLRRGDDAEASGHDLVSISGGVATVIPTFSAVYSWLATGHG